MDVSRTQMARTFLRIRATAYGGPAIVAQSILSMTRPAIKNWRGLILAAGAAVAFFAGANTLLVLAAALAGVLEGLVWPSKRNLAGTPDSQTLNAATADRNYRRTLLVTTGVTLAFVVALLASGARASVRLQRQDDPSARRLVRTAAESDEERMAVFRAVRDDIRASLIPELERQ